MDCEPFGQRDWGERLTQEVGVVARDDLNRVVLELESRAMHIHSDSIGDSKQCAKPFHARIIGQQRRKGVVALNAGRLLAAIKLDQEGNQDSIAMRVAIVQAVGEEIATMFMALVKIQRRADIHEPRARLEVGLILRIETMQRLQQVKQPQRIRRRELGARILDRESINQAAQARVEAARKGEIACAQEVAQKHAFAHANAACNDLLGLEMFEQEAKDERAAADIVESFFGDSELFELLCRCGRINFFIKLFVLLRVVLERM